MKFLNDSKFYNWKHSYSETHKPVWRCNLCNKFMSSVALVATLTPADWGIHPPPYKCPHCKKELLK
jgi:rubrerythrin